MIGTSLGHFTITSKLGEGGMGEVWQAADTRLDREVAIKLLPEDFDADPDRHARFEREAKLLAALNHPNVATLYGLEHLGGRHALVMELVPGEGLDERLTHGPIPMDEAVAIAVQIARGLEAAHDHGIIHRDLKPANVRVRPDATVKVLDFGLAKAWQSDSDQAGLSMSPTITHNATAAGVILGTAAYMAPEQARGKLVDRRADVWAFGVVLWEMITGQRLFQGETLTDVIAAVVTFEPDWEALPPETPAALRRLLERCLRRDPRQRMPDIGACRLELEELDDAGAVTTAEPPPKPQAPTSGGARRWLGLGLIAVAMAGAAILGHWIATSRTVTQRVAFEVPPPKDSNGFHLHPERPGVVTVSPDGTMLTFTALVDNSPHLYVRALDSTEARQVPGTEGAQYPFWSPDSTEIGFYNGFAVRRVRVAGMVSPPVTICETQEMKGASWAPDGTVIFAPNAAAGLVRVSANGGTPEPLTTLDPSSGEDSHRHPRFLPDGRHFVFLARVRSGSPDNHIRLGSLDDPSTSILTTSSAAAEVASEHLLFMRDSSLLAQRLDVDGGTLVGTPRVVTEHLRFTAGGTALAVFSASQNGVIAYERTGIGGNRRLVWRDRSGRELGVLGDEARYNDIRLSPDGRLVAVTISGPGSGRDDLWLYDIDRDVRTRLTFDEADEWGGAWLPGSNGVIFGSDRFGTYDLYRIDLGGAEPERPVLEDEAVDLPMSVSPDGRWLLYGTQHPERASVLWDIMALDLERGESIPMVATPSEEGAASFSPDGRWLLYHSAESGSYQTYITRFPELGRKWQVSTDGGLWPEWWNGGREVLYRTSTTLFSVPVDLTGDRVVIGTPQSMYQVDPEMTNSYRYSPHPDGERILFVESTTGRAARPLTVEIGWTERVFGSVGPS